MEVGSLVQGRAWHTSTLLPDGKVLVVGGSTEGIAVDETLILDSAELYDPESRTFSKTKGGLSQVRWTHSAVLLPDGRVLIIGGRDGNNRFLKEIELWDPALNEFRSAGSLLNDHEGLQVFLRSDGKVQIVGGYNDSLQITEKERFTEIFDPASGTSELDFSIPEVYKNSTLVPLDDHRFLMLGGENGLGSWHQVDWADLYSTDGSQPNPRAESFLPTAFCSNTAVLAAEGKVVCAGGYNQTLGGAIDDIAVIDTTSIPMQVDGYKLRKDRMNHQTIVLRNGDVAFVGGETFTGLINTTYLADIETFNLSTRKTSVFPLRLTYPRALHTVTPLNNSAFLIVGGYNYSTIGGGTFPSYSNCELLIYE